MFYTFAPKFVVVCAKWFLPGLLHDLTRVEAFQALALVEDAFLWKLFVDVLTGVATS